MLRFDVIFQRLFIDECIEALRALIRNTFMFGPYMLNIFMLVTKSRIALLAIELQSPMLGFDMDIQGSAGRVLIGTIRTFVPKFLVNHSDMFVQGIL